MKTVSVSGAKNPERVHGTCARGDGVVQAAERFRAAMRAQSEDWESPFEALRDRSPGRDVGFGA